MQIIVKSSGVSQDAIAASLEKRARLRSAIISSWASRGTRGESERVKDFEGKGSKRGLTPVASFSVHHADHLTKTYGEGWMRDKKAIRHAAERDPMVARQKRQLEYAADAVKSNS